MKLIDAIRRVDEIEGKTICLRRPWTAESEICLASVPPMSKIPERILSEGYEYFIEGSIFRELIDIPEVHGATDKEKVDLIIYYAQNDAYPDWIYKAR